MPFGMHTPQRLCEDQRPTEIAECKACEAVHHYSAAANCSSARAAVAPEGTILKPRRGAPLFHSIALPLAKKLHNRTCVGENQTLARSSNKCGDIAAIL